MKDLTTVQSELVALGDAEYKAFHSKLIPNIEEERIIGVRTPLLRKYAKDLFAKNEGEAFIKELPHSFYEENNLHAFLLEQILDYDILIKRIDDFLPYVDNWATCDMMSPKCFSKHLDRLYEDAYRWIASNHTYAVRFGICVLMKYYLGENLKSECLDKVSQIKSDEYYIKMAVAWYFATALTKNYDIALRYIQGHALDVWTHNKAIQKACESYQISKENKDFLRRLKIK